MRDVTTYEVWEVFPAKNGGGRIRVAAGLLNPNEAALVRTAHAKAAKQSSGFYGKFVVLKREVRYTQV